MVKVKSKAESDREAQNALLEMKHKMGTWQGVQSELKISKGYLNRVARGKRPASNRLRLALGLRPLHVTVSPLPCGHAPGGKRCLICQPPTKYPPHRVMRITELRRRIGRLHFAEQVKDEIERELTA